MKSFGELKIETAERDETIASLVPTPAPRRVQRRYTSYVNLAYQLRPFPFLAAADMWQSYTVDLS